jgi:hypothetical protein
MFGDAIGDSYGAGGLGLSGVGEGGGSRDGGSDIPDSGVVQGVVRGFGNLSFPQPEGGMVTVVYPILFNPGD